MGRRALGREILAGRLCGPDRDRATDVVFLSLSVWHTDLGKECNHIAHTRRSGWRAAPPRPTVAAASAPSHPPLCGGSAGPPGGAGAHVGLPLCEPVRALFAAHAASSRAAEGTPAFGLSLPKIVPAEMGFYLL